MIKDKIHASHEPSLEPASPAAPRAGARQWLHSLERFTRLLFGSASDDSSASPTILQPVSDADPAVQDDPQPAQPREDATPSLPSQTGEAPGGQSEAAAPTGAALVVPEARTAPSRSQTWAGHGGPALALDLDASAPLAEPHQRPDHTEHRIQVTAPVSVPDEQLPDWQGQVVDDVLRLTRRASSSMQNWTITLPLRPDVLPDSLLRIEAWPHSLSLRFATNSPISHGRIHAHRHRLEALLSQRLNRRYQIDVDVV